MEPAAGHSRQGHADTRRQPQGGFLPRHDLHDQQPRRFRNGSLLSPEAGIRGAARNVASALAAVEDEAERQDDASGVDAARRKFTPEFMNRLDKIVVFKPLGEAELKKILDIELNMVQQRIFNSAPERAFVFHADRCGEGVSVARRHRPEVRRASPEARDRAAAGASDVEPDRHRAGARRRSGSASISTPRTSNSVS